MMSQWLIPFLCLGLLFTTTPQTKNSRKKAAQKFLSQGKSWLAQGELEKALSEYDQAIQHDPTLAEAWYGRGVVKFLQADYESALGDLDRAIKIKPKEP